MIDRASLIKAEIKMLRKEVKNNIAELGNSESERIGLFKDLEIYDNILSFIDSMQEESATSVWHDANEAPVNDEKHLWVVVSFKNGDIHTCFVSTLVKWQNAQLDAIDCWAYREELLNIK